MKNGLRKNGIFCERKDFWATFMWQSMSLSTVFVQLTISRVACYHSLGSPSHMSTDRVFTAQSHHHVNLLHQHLGVFVTFVIQWVDPCNLVSSHWMDLKQSQYGQYWCVFAVVEKSSSMFLLIPIYSLKIKEWQVSSKPGIFMIFQSCTWLKEILYQK